MRVFHSIAELKAKANWYPPGFVDQALALGRVEGEKLILDQVARQRLSRAFPQMKQARLDIAQFKSRASELPEGYVDYVLARGKIEGDVVVLDAAAKRDIDAEFSFYRPIGHDVALLRSKAAQLPEGYVDYVLGRGKIKDGIVILDPTAQKEVEKRFPGQIPDGLKVHGPSATTDESTEIAESSIAGILGKIPLGKVVVYTAAVTGACLKEPPPAWRDAADFVVFQDVSPNVAGWGARQPHRRFKDPERNVLRHKILSHVYFPEAEYSLWIDGSVMLKTALELDRWVARHLATCDLAVFAHPRHNCCYQEGADCIRNFRDAAGVIDRQLEKYHRDGYPAKSGLPDCTVLFRRHTPAIHRFNELWYREIQAHSRCEQLSFGYAARKAGVKCAFMPGSALNSPHFSHQPSVKISSPGQVMKKPPPIRFQKPQAIILSHPRSGTHFLEASLSSHPRVHIRDEFIRKYVWTSANEFVNFVNARRRIYTNKPFQVNLGIVMYQDVPTFEKLFCPLAEVKIIHLLRNPLRVARSYAQMWADIVHYGKDYRYHWGASTERPPHVPLTADYLRDVITNIYSSIAELGLSFPPIKGSLPPAGEPESFERNMEILQAAIRHQQEHFGRILATHPDTLAVDYDTITGNAQTNQVPEAFCRDILGFLGLDYRPLTNQLAKTG